MELLTRDVSKQGNEFIVVEKTKKTYTRDALVNELQNTKMHKNNVIEHSKQLKSEYDEITKKELELEEMLLQLNDEDFKEIG